jgi:hypothetical protein
MRGGTCTVIVNGLVSLRVQLPNDRDTPCTADVPSSLLTALKSVPSNGRIELSCCFFGEYDVGVLDERPWIAWLDINDGLSTMCLGNVPKHERAPSIVTDWLYVTITSLRLVVQHVSHDAGLLNDADISGVRLATPHHEVRLLREVTTLMKEPIVNPPPRGSVLNTVVQSRVKDLAVYDEVMINAYNGAWKTFLSNHTDSITIHNGPLDDDNPRAYKAPFRLILNDDLPNYASNDSIHAKESYNARSTLPHLVITILAERAHDHLELLSRLALAHEFTSLLTPSPGVVKRVLRSHAARVQVTDDPIHTCIASLSCE